MSSSDDDTPLAAAKLKGPATNGTYPVGGHWASALVLSVAQTAKLYPSIYCLVNQIASPKKPSPLIITSLLGSGPKSRNIIPKSVDKAMDKANQAANNAPAGISIRNGPVDEMDLDEPTATGTSKRKARISMGNGHSYKEVSEDDKPLVCHFAKTSEVRLDNANRC